MVNGLASNPLPFTSSIPDLHLTSGSPARPAIAAVVSPAAGDPRLSLTYGGLGIVTPAGGITTVAAVGSGVACVAVDAAGNLYVSGGYVIVKVDTAGNVTPFAGNPTTAGFSGDGGPATAALLFGPRGLRVDASGNVWVADTGNNRIQEFSSSGAFVQTFGSLGGGNGQFVGPVGIACFNTNGSSGPCNALDISDTGNNRIQQFTLNTSPPTFAAAFGALGTGQGQFRGPFAVATEPGLVFVADPYNQRIQMFFDSPGSLVNGYWITSSGLYSTSYVFTYPSPYGVAVDGNGLVWTTDYNANKVVAFGNNLALPILVGPFGVTGGGPGQLFHPTYIAIGAIPDNT